MSRWGSRVLGAALRLSAVLFALQVVIGITGLPRALTRWLNCSGMPRPESANHLVILGGSGMPSSETLMRCYYGAYYAARHPDCRCIIALDTWGGSGAGNAERMRNELMVRGVGPDRILVESEGRNTHEQAENIRRMLGPEAAGQPVLIVTSHFHMRRALLSFRKAGFSEAAVLPAFSVSTEDDFRGAVEVWGGMSSPLQWLAVARYGFWINTSAQPWVLRELLALLSYRLRGWI